MQKTPEELACAKKNAEDDLSEESDQMWFVRTDSAGKQMCVKDWTEVGCDRRPGELRWSKKDKRARELSADEKQEYQRKQEAKARLSKRQLREAFQPF